MAGDAHDPCVSVAPAHFFAAVETARLVSKNNRSHVERPNLLSQQRIGPGMDPLSSDVVDGNRDLLRPCRKEIPALARGDLGNFGRQRSPRESQRMSL